MKEAIDSYIKADDPSAYMEVVQAANRNGKAKHPQALRLFGYELGYWIYVEQQGFLGLVNSVSEEMGAVSTWNGWSPCLVRFLSTSLSVLLYQM